MIGKVCVYYDTRYLIVAKSKDYKDDPLPYLGLALNDRGLINALIETRWFSKNDELSPDQSYKVRIKK
jgi:hypothetical protein